VRAKAIPHQVLRAFEGVDLILHAGDLVQPDVLRVLRQVAPVEAVAGNNDTPATAATLGLTKAFDLAGYRIGLTHGHIGTGKSSVQRALSQCPDADCVVFGHSHIAYCQYHGPILAVNPGSATDRRRSPHCSYGFLYLEPGGLRAEIHYLDQDGGSQP
jgi:putative phosphoesterase